MSTSSRTRKIILILIVVLLVQTFVVIPTHAAPPESGACFHYTIRRGDTLSGIAFRYGDGLYAMAARNGIFNLNRIFAGRTLLVCPGAAPIVKHPVSPTLYRVQFGDTLTGIARRFGTTVGRIAALNGIANPNRIFVGQVLRIF